MVRTLDDLSRDERLYFRDQFREARAQALGDAEGYEAILFALESLGMHLLGRRGTLGGYRKLLEDLAARSIVETKGDGAHISFSRLYELVRLGRNDAMHQGAAARNLTAQAVELAIFLEDALMVDISTVECFMIRNTLCALPWQQLSIIRRAMLEHSFSYLPIYTSIKAQEGWYLISDHAIATCTRIADGEKRLGQSVGELIAAKYLHLDKAVICEPGMAIQEALNLTNGQPLLICRKDKQTDLLGILTPFDLL